MPISFETEAPTVITVEQMQAIQVRMRAESAFYNQRISDIESSGQIVVVRIGPASLIGGEVSEASTNYDPVKPTNTVKIPLEYLQNTFYDGVKPMTIERILAHELAGHVWQDVNKITHDPTKPYDFYTNNIVQQEKVNGIPVAVDDSEAGGINSAMYAENEIMKAFGEAVDSAYGTIKNTFGGPVHYYDENGVLSSLANSSNFSPIKLLNDGISDLVDWVKTALSQISPLVLDLNGNGMELTDLNSASAVYWDIDKDGFKEASAWVGKNDGLLAIDLNKNGVIDNHGELFGTDTTDGFTVLKAYDINQDNKITAEDAVWGKLLVWQDANGDGQSQSGELKTLDSLKITSINLNATNTNTVIAGNNITQTSSFTMNGATKTIVDAWFKYDQVNSIYMSTTSLNSTAKSLPNLQGDGNMPNLVTAMSKDATATGNLLDLVDAFSRKDFAAIFSGDATIPNAVRAIMYRWAGVDAVVAGSRGPNVDAKELGFIEKLMGESFTQRNYDSNPGVIAGANLHAAFMEAFNHIYSSLLLQISGKQLFTGTISYDMASDSFTGITGLNTTSLTSLQNEAKALTTTAARQTLWDNVVRVIEFSIGTTALSAGNKTALDNAIKASDATLTLAKIVADLHPGDGNTIVNGFAGDDVITTGAGNDKVYGDTGNDIIKTGAGNDQIDGGADGFPSGLPGGNDQMTGGPGDDYINGNVGNDIYYYNVGDGRDTYTDVSGADKIIFGTGITAANLTYTRQGASDLLITISASTAGGITIADQFKGAGGIETLQFADGSTVNLAALNYTANGTNNADSLTGIAAGGGKNDTLNGLGGDDTLDGGAGDDKLYGGVGNDKLLGGDGNDILQGDAGDDTVTGGTGNDKYYYSSGKDVYSDISGTDVIYFGSAYASSAAKYYKFGNDLMVFFTLDNNVTIKDFFSGTSNSIKSADYNGTAVDLTKVAYILQGDAAANTLVGTASGDYFWGMDGDDKMTGNAGDDVMFGGSGNDTINGNDGNDTLDGGAGNDILNGGNGNDIFVYESGKDVLYDSGAGIDTIRLAAGWVAADAAFNRYTTAASDLVLTLSAVNSITVASQFSVAGNAIETLAYADGTTIDLTHAHITTYGTESNETLNGVTLGGSPDDTIYGQGGNDTLNGYAGDDKLYGGDGNDTLNGGDGNDFLDGGAGDDKLNGDYGNDTYYYSAGKDVLYDSGNYGMDTIQLSSAWIAANIKYDRYMSSPNDLVLDLNATNSITVTKQFWDTTNSIETLKFSDSSTFTLTTVKVTTYGTDGNDTINGITVSASPDDTIFGGNGNDTINGGAGNDKIFGQAGIDTLTGGAGADTFAFEKATAFSGIDVIKDFHTTESDKINLSDIFTTHPTASNIDSFVSLTASGSNMVLMVDKDGAGIASSFQQIATLEAVSGLNIHDLLNKGSLLV